MALRGLAGAAAFLAAVVVRVWDGLRPRLGLAGLAGLLGVSLLSWRSQTL